MRPPARHALAAALITATSALPIAAEAIAPPAGENLSKIYDGKLDRVEGGRAIDWTVAHEDVWRLSEFKYTLRGKLELEFGPSTLVLGKHTDTKGAKSAVWAALFPDEPREITTSEPGEGDSATAIFMRFHPSVVGDLFPAKAVEGPGDPMALVRAKEQYGHKINSGWQSNNMPVVPIKESIVFDVDTVEGDRRYYTIDTKTKKLGYVAAFAGRPLKPFGGDPLGKGEGKKLFEEAWKAFDREYAMFVAKEDVDWDALKDRFEPLADAAANSYELAGVIGLLVSELRDLHVWVKHGERWIPTYNRFRVMNGNFQAIKPQIANLESSSGVTYGTVGGRFGYVLVENLTNPALSDTFDEALDALGETPGLVIDLRFNGGGDELLGQRLAGRFLKKKAAYAKNQYRSGSKHSSLGKKIVRECEPRGPWRYEAPVVVLQGEKTMSSAESLVMMFAAAKNVTTMGSNTAGSSANPRRLELAHGITVNMPRWLDLDLKGKPIDAVGVPPVVQCDASEPGDFKDGDPVFEAALEHLRKTKNKKPGRR